MDSIRKLVNLPEEELVAETFVINWFGFLYQVFYP